MEENNKTIDVSKICPKSEDGKHKWEVRLDSPGHHGDKKLVEMFVCPLCGQKKPIRT